MRTIRFLIMYFRLGEPLKFLIWFLLFHSSGKSPCVLNNNICCLCCLKTWKSMPLFLDYSTIGGSPNLHQVVGTGMSFLYVGNTFFSSMVLQTRQLNRFNCIMAITTPFDSRKCLPKFFRDPKINKRSFKTWTCNFQPNHRNQTIFNINGDEKFPILGQL